jgi:hypothetical protein
MKKIIGAAAAATAVLALAGCQTTPAPKPSPATIAGIGEYSYVLTDIGTGDPMGSDTFVHGANDTNVSYGYTRTGNTYIGQMDVITPSGPFTHYVNFEVSGHDIVSASGGSTNVPGTGVELSDDAPEISTTTASAACPGSAALVMNFDGESTEEGVPTGTHMDLTYTVCDPIAAAWFG